MLSRWILSNFKSYTGNTSLKLAPLTLLCGANSSGKSSILQSMLLIKQTLEHSPAERVIALNGPLVQLGTFSDILNNKSAAANTPHIGIGWEINHFSDENSSSAVYLGEFQVVHSSMNFSFDTSGPVAERATLELQPDLKSASISADLTDTTGERHEIKVAIERVAGRGRRLQYDSSTLGDADKLRFRITEIDQETKDVAGPSYATSDVVGANVHHFSPSALIIRYDRNLRLSKMGATILTDVAGARRFRIPSLKLSHGIREILEVALAPLKANPRHADAISRFLDFNESELTYESVSMKYRELPPILRRSMREALTSYEGDISKRIYEDLGRDSTVSLVRVESMTKVTSANEHFFRFLLRYLGPLRADPRPLYPLQALSSPTDVGPKGEQTAAVLHLNSKRKVKNIASSSFKNSPIDSHIDEVTLTTAVADWLDYLGVAEGFETIEKGKLGHELRVRTPGTTEFQDLTNVGVGVSQVLPIVVTCLLAAPGSTIIIEQPELHLHPAVQARLADFFVAMIMLQRQCVIETHSEHVIERIRFRIAQDRTNFIQDKTKIFFFGKENGSTEVSEIAVNRFGSIDDWPRDFFDQSQIANEAIVLMALERHKAERSRAKEDGGSV